MIWVGCAALCFLSIIPCHFVLRCRIRSSRSSPFGAFASCLSLGVMGNRTGAGAYAYGISLLMVWLWSLSLSRDVFALIFWTRKGPIHIETVSSRPLSFTSGLETLSTVQGEAPLLAWSLTVLAFFFFWTARLLQESSARGCNGPTECWHHHQRAQHPKFPTTHRALVHTFGNQNSAFILKQDPEGPNFYIGSSKRNS
jgi:hypothetical protein